jgi:phosphatidylglycerophosphate synthase
MEQTIINNIQKYKYESKDDSTLTSIYYKLAYKILDYIPPSISPNIITLFGLTAIMISVCINLSLSWLLPIPILAFITSSCLFIYQIADILDGRQANKLKMYNNATTEIFDHGCDSLTLSMSLINSIFIFDITDPVIAVSMFILTTTIFYLPTWEHHCTGIMRFRGGLCNPTESLTSLQFAYLIVGFIPYFRSNISLQYGFITILFIYTIRCAIDSTYTAFTINKYNMTISQRLIGYIPLVLLYTLPVLLYPTSPMAVIKYTPLFNITIFELIWTQISHSELNLSNIIIIYLIQLHDWYINPLIMFILIIYNFMNIIRKLCRALDMDYFWTIQPDKQN